MQRLIQQSGALRGIWLLVVASFFSFFLIHLDDQGIIAILSSWLLLVFAHGYRRRSHIAAIAFGIMTSLYALALVASLVFGIWLLLFGFVPLFSLGRWTELWLLISLIGVATVHCDQNGKGGVLSIFRRRSVATACTVFLFITIAAVWSGLVRLKANTRLTHSLICDTNTNNDIRAVKVPLDKMVHLDIADVGELLIDFTGLERHHADYRWFFIPIESEDLFGTGSVFEHVDRFGCIQTINTEKSETIIRAGSVGVQWSYCDSTSTWIYIHPSRTTYQLLPDDNIP